MRFSPAILLGLSLLCINWHCCYGQITINNYQKRLADSQTALDSIDNVVTLVDLYLDRNIDSARYFLDITRQLTTREQDTIGLSIYHLLLGKFYKNAAETDLVVPNLLLAEKLSEAADYQAGLELVRVELGYFYRNTGKLDSSNLYMRKVYENSDNQEDRMSALNGIALNYKSVGAYEKALEGFYEMLEVTSRNNHEDLGIIYSNIALVIQSQGEDEKATKMFRKALSESQKTDNLKAILYAEKMLAGRYRLNGQYDSAIYYLKSAQIKAAKIASSLEGASIAINLGDTYTELNKWADAKRAFADARELMKTNSLAFTNSFYRKSFAHYQYRNPAISTSEAIATLNIAEDLAQANDMTDELRSIYEMKSTYLADIDPTLALEYFRKFHYLSDSINTLKNRNYAAMLETQFETARKDQSIRSLEQEKAINLLQLKQQKTAIYASAGILLLLVLGGTLLFQQRRLKHRNMMENLQHRLLRIQMNPHFIFNALMSIQHFMMKNKPEQAGLYLSKFARLMRQILELSREETIELQEEKDMLENYIEIQRMRADNQFDYEIIIDESLMEKEVKIPPMYAQPFVENAIEHGNLGSVDNGKLIIHFREKNNKMEVVIEDNGTGLDSNTQLKSHNSLSTIITKERLSILEKRFRDHFNISITGRIDALKSSGTRVEIELPLLSE